MEKPLIPIKQEHQHDILDTASGASYVETWNFDWIPYATSGIQRHISARYDNCKWQLWERNLKRKIYAPVHQKGSDKHEQ